MAAPNKVVGAYHVQQPKKLPTSACNGHPNTICKACLKKHVNAGVNEKGSIEIKSVIQRLHLATSKESHFAPSCPVPTCEKPLDYLDIKRFASKSVFDR